MPNVPTLTETRGKMVVTASDDSKLANRTDEQAGYSIKTGQPVVAAVDNTSSALHLGSTGVIPFPSSDRTGVDDPEEDYVHGNPSQAQNTVSLFEDIKALHVLRCCFLNALAYRQRCQ